MFANCDPGVATVDDLAGLVRAAKPQKMRETTRAQLGLVRKNDELRFEKTKLQDENHMLRKQLKDALKDAEDPLLLSDWVDTPY